MKKISLTLVSVIFSILIFAQSPQSFKYQAVYRDNTGNIIANRSIAVQIKILQSSATGTEVFTETHNISTNAFGLFNIEIGSINATDFATIDWANGPYFVNTIIEGTDFGTSQLLSVPYALHAKTAETITGGITETDPFYSAWDKDYSDLINKPTIPAEADGSETKLTAGTNINITGSGTTASPYEISATGSGASGHYVGELYGGGIVYYVYDNGQHGLIASLDDLNSGNDAAWSATNNVEIGATAQSFYDGASNTAAIVAQDATAGYAATLCNNYTGGSQTDWYLPANWELNLLYNSAYLINKNLENDGDANTNGLSFGDYWSSTEYNKSNAWIYKFSYGNASVDGKSYAYRVRAVRTF